MATEISLFLEKNNCSTWLDKHQLIPGTEWQREIRKAIRESDYFLALISNQSLARRGFIHAELKEALAVWYETPYSKVYLIPVRVDNCDLSKVGLSDIQWVDLFDGNSHSISKTSWNRAIESILNAVSYGRGHINNALSKELVTDIVEYKKEREEFEKNIGNTLRTTFTVSAASEARCQFADNIIVRLFKEVCSEGGFLSTKFTLIARGGFGRRYLARNSDIDLTLLHTESDTRDAEKLFDVFSTLLTDIFGEIKVAAMINTCYECVDHWHTNFNSLAAFSSMRFIYGDFSIYTDLIEKWHKYVSEVNPNVIKDGLNKQPFFRDIEPETPSLLNIKFCPGGLMEISLISFIETFLKVNKIDYTNITNDNIAIDQARNFMLLLREEIFLKTKTSAITIGQLSMVAKHIYKGIENPTETLISELHQQRLQVRKRFNSLICLIPE